MFYLPKGDYKHGRYPLGRHVGVESCVAMFGTWGVGGSAIRPPPIPSTELGLNPKPYRVYGFNVEGFRVVFWFPGLRFRV